MHTTPPRSTDIRYSCIIVNYQAGAALILCVESVLAWHPDLPIEVLVLDNASEDGSMQPVYELARHEPRLRAWATGGNLGFARACNLGAREAHGEYLCFLNPDLECVMPLLEVLGGFLDTHAEAGAVGPLLRYLDGRLQPSRGRFPKLSTSLAAWARLKRYLPRDEWLIRWSGGLLRGWFAQLGALLPVEQVDYVTGACLMVRATSFREVGGFDEDFFLYYDEIDLCFRLKQRGESTWFLGTVEARHQVEGSALSDPWFIVWHRRRSMLAWFAKHHPAWQNWVVRAAFRWEVCWGWLLLPLVGNLAERDRRQHYLRKLGQLLRGESTRCEW